VQLSEQAPDVVLMVSTFAGFPEQKDSERGLSGGVK